MIPVTKPYLPKREKYKAYVDSIYERAWLTNNGPLVQCLEQELRSYLGLDQLLFVNNGTIALQLGIKALGLKGELITTPFSYVATTTSIVWEGCKPIFVDIDEDTLNIDPQKIETAITEKTTAILATHCFGNACDIEEIEKIAQKHQLKVIYDAAHCFGTNYKGESVFNYGDISTCSLHATKIMHSVEGGFVVAKNEETLNRLSYMRNFGHDGPERFNGVGINGKNSEFHAAMGLCVLEDVDEIMKVRKQQSIRYDELLQHLPIRKPKIQIDCEYNYSYYPILLETEQLCLRVINSLNQYDIFPRRYFYPSLNKLDYIKNKGKTPISDDCSSRIICLPLYHNLTIGNQELICNTISKSILNG